LLDAMRSADSLPGTCFTRTQTFILLYLFVFSLQLLSNYNLSGLIPIT